MSKPRDSSSERAPIPWADPAREAAFHQWLEGIAEEFGLMPHTLTSASADASFRRYLRIDSTQGTRIIMDAPPPLEDVRPFVHVASLLDQAALTGPRILACDAERGFLLTTDLGTELYLGALKAGPEARVEGLMREAIKALVQWQARVDAQALPPYDEAALRAQLHNLFLDLVLDHDHKVAFTRKVIAEGLELPTLLRKQNLTYLESALVLFLRQRLTQSEAQGERAVISHQEMVEHLSVYERDKNVDHSRFERQIEGAVEKAKKLSLLRKLLPRLREVEDVDGPAPLGRDQHQVDLAPRLGHRPAESIEEPEGILGDDLDGPSVDAALLVDKGGGGGGHPLVPFAVGRADAGAVDLEANADGFRRGSLGVADKSGPEGKPAGGGGAPEDAAARQARPAGNDLPGGGHGHSSLGCRPPFGRSLFPAGGQARCPRPGLARPSILIIDAAALKLRFSASDGPEAMCCCAT